MLTLCVQLFTLKQFNCDSEQKMTLKEMLGPFFWAFTRWQHWVQKVRATWMLIKTWPELWGHRARETRSPHLREFLVFVWKTVHCVVEHFLHQTFLIIWNKQTKGAHFLKFSHGCSENFLNISTKHILSLCVLTMPLTLSHSHTHSFESF